MDGKIIKTGNLEQSEILTLIVPFEYEIYCIGLKRFDAVALSVARLSIGFPGIKVSNISHKLLLFFILTDEPIA
jgi:hypothetical protein